MPTVRHSSADVDLTGFDWSKVDATSAEDIARQIEEDPDTAPDLSGLPPGDLRPVWPEADHRPMRVRKAR